MTRGGRPARRQWQLPRAIGAVLDHLPRYPTSLAFAEALNFGLGPRLDREAAAALDGKVLRLVVRDAGLVLSVRRRASLFEPVPARAPADLAIGATLHDFALLAARREDPDTLFFARRLTIEGDTETGLVVKNVLDAADLPQLSALAERGLRLAERLRPSR